MQSRYYAQGRIAALEELHLTKLAAPWYSRARHAIPQLSQRLQAHGPHIEKQVYKVLPGAQPYFKGVPAQAINEAIIGTGFGSALGAGIGALTAEPGERGEAALRGAGTGAWQGAAFGGLSGLVRGPIVNASRNRLATIAKQQGHASPVAAANKEYGKSWLTNAKELATGKGAFGRQGSAVAAGGGLAGLALGDFYVPSLVMPLEHSAPTDQRTTTASAKKPKKEKPPKVTLIPTEMAGSYIGGMSTNLGTRALLRAKKFPFQARLNPKGYAREVIPIVVTSAGTLVGYISAKKLKQLDTLPSTKRKK